MSFEAFAAQIQGLTATGGGIWVDNSPDGSQTLWHLCAPRKDECNSHTMALGMMMRDLIETHGAAFHVLQYQGISCGSLDGGDDFTRVSFSAAQTHETHLLAHTTLSRLYTRELADRLQRSSAAGGDAVYLLHLRHRRQYLWLAGYLQLAAAGNRLRRIHGDGEDGARRGAQACVRL